MKPKITIGICVKNAEKTIKDTILSIFEQDYPYELMEIIIVDGCSEDNTLHIINNILKKSDIRKFILYEKDGLGYARQMVVNISKGDYIIWVDGDVILSNDYVTKQITIIEQNEKIGIVAGKHKLNTRDKIFAKLQDIAYIAIEHKFGGLKDSSRLPGTSGSIFRVKAIKQVGGFNVNIKGVGEDIELAYRIKKAGWLIYIGAGGTFYEKRRSNLKEIWDHYLWYGIGGYYLFHKHRLINLYEMIPISGFFAGVWYSIIAYKVLRRKNVFILPLYYVFQRLAWCYGFMKSQKRL